MSSFSININGLKAAIKAAENWNTNFDGKTHWFCCEEEPDWFDDPEYIIPSNAIIEFG